MSIMLENINVCVRLCVDRLFGSGGSCMGCGESIPANEMVYRAQGNVYHIRCFVCVACRHPLQAGDRYVETFAFFEMLYMFFVCRMPCIIR